MRTQVNPLRHRFKSVARLAVRWPARLLGQVLPLSARRNLVSLAGRRNCRSSRVRNGDAA